MKKCIFIILAIFTFATSSVMAQKDLPSWLVGKWTDGTLIIQITSDNKMRVYENDILTKEGEFSLDGEFVDVEWSKDLKPDKGIYLMVNTHPQYKYLAWEGGDKLTKMPDNYSAAKTDSEEKDYNGGINPNMMTQNAKRCWKNITWAYGEWEIPAGHRSGKVYNIRITPFYYQVIKDRKDGEALDFSAQPKKWYKLMEGENSVLGNVVYIDDLYFDFIDNRIYLASGIDKKIYLNQTVVYITSTIKTIFWGVFGVVCLAILLGLYILVKKFIAYCKLLIAKIKETLDEKRKQMEEKRKKLLEKSKQQKEQAKVNYSQQQAKMRETLTSTMDGVKSNLKDMSEKAAEADLSGKAANLMQNVKQTISEAAAKTNREASENEVSSNSETKTVGKGVNLTAFIKPALAILVAIWLLGKCSGCGEDSESDFGSGSEYVQKEDYSWIHGTWVRNVSDGKHILSFSSNGIYTLSMQSPVWGNTTETGIYSVRNGSIRLDSRDGYPSYVEIEGKRLKDHEGYFTKR